MDWKYWGFKENPFNTQPIDKDTLDVFIGHSNQVEICNSFLSSRSTIIVIEGGRGIGTTSFANYLRFQPKNNKNFLSPISEIGIQRNWTVEILLSSVIANIVREFELQNNKKVLQNKYFLEAKALTQRISEAYTSFGLSGGVAGFSMGGNYGKSGIITQPHIVPPTELHFYLSTLGELAKDCGYKNGILIQLNNLDLGIIHQEDYLHYLLNAIRDIMQIRYLNWFLVGDVGLSLFISQKIDRLDDIVSYHLNLKPATFKEFKNIVKKRIEYYKEIKNYVMPLEDDVFEYLYEITDGRLRYIFSLINSLVKIICKGNLINTISLDMAKPMIKELAENRIKRNNLNKSEEMILKIIVKNKEITCAEISRKLKKDSGYITKITTSLAENKLIAFNKIGNKKIYFPFLDAKIAYG